MYKLEHVVLTALVAVKSKVSFTRLHEKNTILRGICACFWVSTSISRELSAFSKLGYVPIHFHGHRF